MFKYIILHAGNQNVFIEGSRLLFKNETNTNMVNEFRSCKQKMSIFMNRIQKINITQHYITLFTVSSSFVVDQIITEA